MPGTVGNNVGLDWGWSPGESGWGLSGFNPGFALLDSIVGLAVFSRALTAPPGSPVRGDRYVPAATATGAWAGQEGKIAWWTGTAWAFITPKVGWRMWDVATSTFRYWTGSAWAQEPAVAPSGDGFLVNAGSVTVRHTNTIAVSTGTTAVNISDATDTVVTGNAAGGTTRIDLNGGYVGQLHSVHHKQGATTEAVTFGTMIALGLTIPSYTPTATPGARDVLLFQKVDASNYILLGLNLGFAV